MRASPSANESLLVSRMELGKAVANALCLYVGRGRRYTVKQLTKATGVPARLIECAKLDPEGRQAEDWRPLKPEELVSISCFLGEAFASEWLRPAKLGAFALPDEDIPLPGELVAECADDTAEVADCAKDGKFGASDERELRSVGQREIRRGMTLVSIGGKRRA